MRLALGFFLSMVLLGGCDEAVEGERLGLYAVRATRITNTCGSQMSGKVQSARFNVALSLQRGVLRWSLEGGAAAANGNYDVFQGTFRIAIEASTQMIAPDRRREIVGCVLRRVDVIEGAVSTSTDAGAPTDASANIDASANVDAGTVIGGFRAVETITYGPESGNCSAIVGVGAGQALALPCQVGYQLEATRVGP